MELIVTVIKSGLLVQGTRTGDPSLIFTLFTLGIVAA